MRDPRLRNWMQNAALVLLTASALFLLARLPLLQSIRLSAPPLFSAEPGGETEDALPAAMFSSVNLMTTGDSEYGRCGRLYISADSEALQEVIPLFQEALGSATLLGAVDDTALREALNTPGLYLELTGGPLPLEAVAAWLGEDVPFVQDVLSMALTAEGDGGASLFLLDGSGRIVRCATALPISALQSSCEKVLPNGSYFAYETGYTTLSPYTVLTPKMVSLPDISAERPAGYSAYNLLTALDFNAHTLSRYTESGGAEVVEESPRTLRIAPDGSVSLISHGGDALTITFEGGAVTDFTYRCRSYTPLEEESAPLLPAGMAQAIAAAYPEAALSIGYEDDGSGRLAAQWYR